MVRPPKKGLNMMEKKSPKQNPIKSFITGSRPSLALSSQYTAHIIVEPNANIMPSLLTPPKLASWPFVAITIAPIKLIRMASSCARLSDCFRIGTERRVSANGQP